MIKKWEYTQRKIVKDKVDILNCFGRLGWELVFKDGDYFYFKREL